MRAFPSCAGYRFVEPMANSQQPHEWYGHKVRRTLRSVGAVATVVVCVTVGNGGVAGAPQTTSTRSVEEPAAVFLTLPMARGFADATQALVEAQEVVREAVTAIGEVRLVDHAQDADVVLTVLGRGRGDVELNAALRALESDVIAPPVPIGATERYIEAMITVGSCRDEAIAAGQRPPASCYSRVFVGLGLSHLDARQPVRGPKPNSWEACANAVARDVRAWLTENASRIRATGD